MKYIKAFEDFVNENINEDRKPEPLKSNQLHDGYVWKNHTYTMGLLIPRDFFDKSSTFDKSRANRKGADWEGMKNKIDLNRQMERQGNFAMAFWDNDNYVIVGGYLQSDGYLFNLHKHLEKEYKNYHADIIKNFSFNAKGQPVMGDNFMVNGKIH